MTDRELLEAAAKAAGIDPDRIDVCQRENGPNPYIEPWNPLTDDGDALRLAVRLGLLVDTGGMAHWGPVTETQFRGWRYTKRRTDGPMETHGSDPYAATRRAIVRAAAEIGRAR